LPNIDDPRPNIDRLGQQLRKSDFYAKLALGVAIAALFIALIELFK